LKKYIENYSKATNPTDRYTSFDYCYNYFKSNNNEYIGENIEQSCMTLGFYLASWGMLRGSSFLLQKSAKYFEPTIHYVASLDKNVWDIDVDNYTNHIKYLLKCKKSLS
jgi:hypothetical protein